MAKKKSSGWATATYRPRPNRATTGTRDCQECNAPAYSHHASWCPTVR